LAIERGLAWRAVVLLFMGIETEYYLFLKEWLAKPTNHSKIVSLR